MNSTLPPISRRRFLAQSRITAAAFMAGCRLGWENRKRNVILIVADDLGYGELGCYGQKLIKTPNLARLASEGLRFTQAYAGSSVCAPSRCCLFTGYHTGNAWVRGNNSERHLPQGTGTLGTLMRNVAHQQTEVVYKLMALMDSLRSPSDLWDIA